MIFFAKDSVRTRKPGYASSALALQGWLTHCYTLRSGVKDSLLNRVLWIRFLAII